MTYRNPFKFFMANNTCFYLVNSDTRETKIVVFFFKDEL